MVGTVCTAGEGGGAGRGQNGQCRMCSRGGWVCNGQRRMHSRGGGAGRGREGVPEECRETHPCQCAWHPHGQPADCTLKHFCGRGAWPQAWSHPHHRRMAANYRPPHPTTTLRLPPSVVLRRPRRGSTGRTSPGASSPAPARTSTTASSPWHRSSAAPSSSCPRATVRTDYTTPPLHHSTLHTARSATLQLWR